MRRRPVACAILLAVSALHVGATPCWAEPPPARSLPATPDEPEMRSVPMVVAGVALGVSGLGATGLGVYLTQQGSTIDCVDCAGASDEAPLVAGGLSAILLGLGMASSGAMLVVLGARDEPGGIRVREIAVGAGSVAVGGSF